MAVRITRTLLLDFVPTDNIERNTELCKMTNNEKNESGKNGLTLKFFANTHRYKSMLQRAGLKGIEPLFDTYKASLLG